MADIADIPTSELVGDLCDTEADIALCLLAVAIGVARYGNGEDGEDGEDVMERLEGNQKIKAAIETELKRRADANNPTA